MRATTKSKHLGQKVSRIRELRGLKQEVLAIEMGVSQQSISHLEKSEFIEDEKLDKIAKALGVTKEAIENFSEEAILNFLENSCSQEIGPDITGMTQPDLLEKLMEVYVENKRLYERLVEAEKQKVQYLEQLLRKLDAGAVEEALNSYQTVPIGRKTKKTPLSAFYIN